MSDKKLNIGVKVDTSPLDAAINKIKELQQLVNKLQTSTPQTPQAQQTQRGGATATATGSPGYEEFRKNFQAVRAQAEKSRAEQDAFKITKDKLQDIDRQLSINARNEARSDRDKKFAEQERNNLLKERITLVGTLQRMEGKTGSGGQPKPGRPDPGMPTSMTGALALLGPTGTAIASTLALSALVAKTVQSAEEGRRFVSEASLRARSTEASAFQTQGQGGQMLQGLINGNASEGAMFDPQRAKASQLAQNAINSRYGVVGGLHPWALAPRAAMGDQAFGALQHGQFTQAARAGLGRLGFTGLQKEFEAGKDKEKTDLQAEQFEALKRGPEGALRTTLADKYLKDYKRDLDFQRQTGLNDSSFRGAFTNSVTGAGFTQEQGMGMSSSIMGAGGSTRASTGLAGFGLQAQRNADMTNAGGLIGTLSQGLGGKDVTKDAFVKLLAEGTRIGLDGSEYREENRKFTEAAAQAVVQSGTTTGGGADQVMEAFGRFFGADKTMSGISAGKSAYNLYQEQSKETTGPRGSLRAAGLMSDPITKNLDAQSRATLLDMGDSVLTEDNPALESIARKASGPDAPVTPKDLIAVRKKVDKNSANLFKSQDVARDKLSSLKKELGVTGDIDSYTGPRSKELRQAYNDAIASQSFGSKELANNPREAAARANEQAEGAPENEFLRRGREEGKKFQLEKGTTGRAGDETEKLQAEASKLANQLFIDMRAEIAPTAAAVTEFAKRCAELRAILNDEKATQDQKKRAIENVYGPVKAPSAPGAGPVSQ